MTRPDYWYKGVYAGCCPVWLADPDGACWVEPRGILGWLLEPLVDCIVQALNYQLSMQNSEFMPHFPYSYETGRQFYRPPRR